jgi:hypothetical protein
MTRQHPLLFFHFGAFFWLRWPVTLLRATKRSQR